MLFVRFEAQDDRPLPGDRPFLPHYSPSFPSPAGHSSYDPFPLRMALIFASPKDQSQLMVEEELITVAFSLAEPMAEGRLLVDETS